MKMCEYKKCIILLWIEVQRPIYNTWENYTQPWYVNTTFANAEASTEKSEIEQKMMRSKEVLFSCQQVHGQLREVNIMSSKQLPSLKHNAYHNKTRITSNDEWLSKSL